MPRSRQLVHNGDQRSDHLKAPLLQSRTALAVDASGNIFVADAGNNRVQVLDSTGNYLREWGSAAGIPPADGQFITPIGLGVDAIGNVFVCDLGNRRIEKFDSSGSFLAKFGGVGVGNGTFSWPVAVAVNSSGQVVVSDYTGNLVQEFEPTF